MRTPLKSISMNTREFIPDSHKAYNRHADKMIDRPIIFIVRPMTRDEVYEFEDLLEVKVVDENNVIKGLGKASKYVWKKCIKEIHNVVTDKGEFQVVSGKDKDELIDNSGLELEALEVTAYVRNLSKLDVEEAKN